MPDIDYEFIFNWVYKKLYEVGLKNTKTET